MPFCLLPPSDLGGQNLSDICKVVTATMLTPCIPQLMPFALDGQMESIYAVTLVDAVDGGHKEKRKFLIGLILILLFRIIDTIFIWKEYLLKRNYY